MLGQHTAGKHGLQGACNDTSPCMRVAVFVGNANRTMVMRDTLHNYIRAACMLGGPTGAMVANALTTLNTMYCCTYTCEHPLHVGSQSATAS